MPLEPTIQTPTPMLDTLSGHSPLAAADSLRVGLKELLGPNATLVEQGVEQGVELFRLTDNWVVGIMLVAIFVAYLFILYAYGGHCGQMVKIILGGHIGIRVADELSYLYMRAVRSSVALGIALWAMVALRVIDLSLPESHSALSSLWIGPMFVVAGVALGAIQRGLTGGICALVRRPDLAQGVSILADTTMALVSLVATPLGLFFVVNAGSSAVWFGVAAVVVAALGLVIFAGKSLIFFIEQKISILLWFLYLCTVVLIPIGIVVALVVRIGTV